MSVSTDRLRKCPFCGEPLVEAKAFSNRTATHMGHPPGSECIISGVNIVISNEPAEIARVAAWNLRASKPEVEKLIEALRHLMLAYVSLLESGRDRIMFLGGQCDPVDVMERGDPALIAAKAAIASLEGEPR